MAFPSKHKMLAQCCFTVGHCHRPWPNSEPTVGLCLMFAGMLGCDHISQLLCIFIMIDIHDE